VKTTIKHTPEPHLKKTNSVFSEKNITKLYVANFAGMGKDTPRTRSKHIKKHIKINTFSRKNHEFS